MLLYPLQYNLQAVCPSFCVRDNCVFNFFFVSVSLSKEHPEFSNTTTVIILFCLLPKVIEENMFALG
jgi:hypothetical protein